MSETIPMVVVSTIYCETDGCSSKIVVHDNLNELTAAAVAIQRGWFVTQGTQRFFHWCEKHRKQ